MFEWPLKCRILWPCARRRCWWWSRSKKRQSVACTRRDTPKYNSHNMITQRDAYCYRLVCGHLRLRNLTANSSLAIPGSGKNQIQNTVMNRLTRNTSGYGTCISTKSVPERMPKKKQNQNEKRPSIQPVAVKKEIGEEKWHIRGQNQNLPMLNISFRTTSFRR